MKMLALTALCVVAVAGCGTDVPTVAEPTATLPLTTPVQTSEEPSATSTPEVDETSPVPSPTSTAVVEPTTAAPTVAATTTGASIAPNQVAAEVTPPGTQISIGEPAVTHVQALEEADEYYGYAVLETTVTDIEQGDPAMFDMFENADELEGMVPWYIHANHVILSIEGDPNANMTPRLSGLLSGGGPAGSAAAFSGFGDVCDLDLYDQLEVGASASTCSVALAPQGTEVTGAAWAGDDYADGYGDENPYTENPVTWTR